ncbi:MAG: FKBP-type peptidyl-prolyl cis-trans isomerase [bacterium]|nr:FKBP-type peptidyl-prolyl cis-trans isomerase [bacterium]
MMNIRIIVLCFIVVGWFTVSPAAENQPQVQPNATQLGDNPAQPIKGVKMQKSKTGLEWQDLKVGKGTSPKKGQKVSVHYTGWLSDGKKFDSSYDRNEPFTFTIGIGQVIKGWDEGVMSMKKGGKRRLYIPPELGYGDKDVAGGLIPANSKLVFEVELIDVKD